MNALGLKIKNKMRTFTALEIRVISGPVISYKTKNLSRFLYFYAILASDNPNLPRFSSKVLKTTFLLACLFVCLLFACFFIIRNHVTNQVEEFNLRFLVISIL